jgi:hypothetical protein
VVGGPEWTRPFAQNEVDPVPRYIRNGRDYAMFVHADPLGGLFMSFYNAGMLLFQNGAPLNPGNPYRDYKKQSSFGTFGVPFFLGMMGEVAVRAFKAAWCAKWFVHRALRPEAFGGLFHMTKSGQAHYPLQRDALNSVALANIFAQKRTYFLPRPFLKDPRSIPPTQKGTRRWRGRAPQSSRRPLTEAFCTPNSPETAPS